MTLFDLALQILRKWYAKEMFDHNLLGWQIRCMCMGLNQSLNVFVQRKWQRYMAQTQAVLACTLEIGNCFISHVT